MTSAAASKLGGASLTLIDSDDAYANGEVFNVAMTVWRGHVTAQHARKVMDQWNKMVQRHGKIAISTLVLPGAPPPTTDLRETLKGAIKDLEASLLGVGLVIEGNEVAAVGSRMFASTLALFLRAPFPLKTFKTAETASEWIATITGHDGRSITKAFNQLRDAVGQ